MSTELAALDGGGGGISAGLDITPVDVVAPIGDLPAVAGAPTTSELDLAEKTAFISGFQSAVLSGHTRPPVRDITRDAVPLQIDAQVQPNWIPPAPAPTRDYIRDDMTREEILRNYNRRTQTEETTELIFNELKIPLLLAIIYFLFQLPIVKLRIVRYLPWLVKSDMNYSARGVIVMSALFGAAFWSLSKIMTQFNRF